MNAAVELLNRAAETWWAYALHATWQSSLVAGGLLLVVWLGRRWPARLRYGLMLIALAKFAIPPMLATPTGVFSWAGPTIATDRAQAVSNEAGGAASADAGPSGAPADPTAAGPAALSPRPAMSWRAWLLLLHVAGSLAAGGWILVQLANVARTSRRAQAVTSGPVFNQLTRLSRKMKLRRPVRLLVCPEAAPPMAFGVLRPAVMIPASVLRDPRSHQVKAILAHELAHHRRGDLWVNWLQVLLGVVWWFNPAIWLLNRVLRKTREDCCDDLLLSRKLTTGGRYCEALLRVASQLGRGVMLGGAAGFAERLHPLGARMQRIMDPRLRRNPRSSWTTLPLLILLAGVLLPGLRSVPVAAVGEAPEQVLADADEGRRDDQLAAVAPGEAVPGSPLDQAASADARVNPPSPGASRPEGTAPAPGMIAYPLAGIDESLGRHAGGRLWIGPHVGETSLDVSLYRRAAPAPPATAASPGWAATARATGETRRAYHALPARHSTEDTARPALAACFALCGTGEPSDPGRLGGAGGVDLRAVMSGRPLPPESCGLVGSGLAGETTESPDWFEQLLKGLFEKGSTQEPSMPSVLIEDVIDFNRDALQFQSGFEAIVQSDGILGAQVDVVWLDGPSQDWLTGRPDGYDSLPAAIDADSLRLVILDIVKDDYFDEEVAMGELIAKVRGALKDSAYRDSGTFVLIPAPATILPLMLGGLALLRRRKRPV